MDVQSTETQRLIATKDALEDEVSESMNGNPVLIFDGECALCSRSVGFMLTHERKPGIVLFAPMQSENSREILRNHGFDPDAMTSVVFIDRGRALVRSAAVLAMCDYLRHPWRWARVFGLIPTPLLDAVYRFTAKNRYRIFGKIDRCIVDSTVAGRTINPDQRDHYPEQEKSPAAG